jgi:DNA-binding response OmpR family regulator
MPIHKVSPNSGAKAMATVGLQICDVVDCLPRKKDTVGNRQECVLLIEDNEEAMLLVRYALQEYGNGTYRLEWADGLTAGLHRLSKGDVDLILLDLGLPESSGAASYASIRKAAPDLPILVLTGDTREQTEFAVTSEGVEDYLVKEDISGALLLQAIRTALYANRRWQEQKASAYKLTQRFLWAYEKCQALSALASRMLTLNRSEPALASAKAIGAIVNNYSESEGAVAAGRADLFIAVERLARAAAFQGNKDLAPQLRALIVPAPKADLFAREQFETAMRRRVQQLDLELPLTQSDILVQDSADLAQLLRQILESVPTLG